MGCSSLRTGKPSTRGCVPMAKAPSLWKDRSKGIQRTRKLSTVNVPCRLEKCEGTLGGVGTAERN
jgi:hypothetical protein